MILVKCRRLGYRHAIEIVDQVLWPVERRVRRIEPEEHAEGLGARLLEPLDGFAGEQRVDIFAFIELRRLVLAATPSVILGR